MSPMARWAAQIYAECSRDFAQTGYWGIGVRLLDDRGIWITNVDVVLKDWMALATEEERRALVLKRLAEAFPLSGGNAIKMRP